MALIRFLCGFCLLFLIGLPVPALIAQDEPPTPSSHFFFAGGGAGIPHDDIHHLMSSSALVRLGYGYRILPHIQADIALDIIFRAAGISLSQQTWIGEIRVRDNEILLPFGARAILPLGRRFELFAGGGAAYLRYEEEAEIPGYPQNEYGSVPCPACTSRDGWGYYGTAGFNIAIEHKRRVWVGLEGKYLHGSTSGVLLGSGTPFGTDDSWFNPSFNLIFRF